MAGLSDVIGQIDIFIDAAELAKANPYLSLQRITPDCEPNLGDVLVPWYERAGVPVIHIPTRVDRSRFPNVHDRLPSPGDSALSIKDIANGRDHPWLDSTRITKPALSTGIFPAYRVKERLLLLDGNHRSISLVRFRVDYAVDLLVLEGPVSRRVMPDLAVFE